MALKESRANSRSKGMPTSRAEGFRGSNPAASANKMFTHFDELTEGELRSHWRAVRVLVEALRVQPRLSKSAAFELIEANLPEGTREVVTAIEGRGAPDRPTKHA